MLNLVKLLLIALIQDNLVNTENALCGVCNDRESNLRPCDFKSKVLSLHCTISRVARNSLRGVLFLKFDSTVNEIDPNFDVFLVGLRLIQTVIPSKSK